MNWVLGKKGSVFLADFPRKATVQKPPHAVSPVPFSLGRRTAAQGAVGVRLFGNRPRVKRVLFLIDSFLVREPPVLSK